MNTESQVELKINTETITTLTAEEESTHPNPPMKVKNGALLILTTIAVVYTLDWAQSFVVTLLLGILLSYTLNPMVAWLEHIKIPRIIGSTIVILAVIFSIIFSAYALRGQIQSIIAKLPDAASKLSTALASRPGDPLTNMQKVQIAATQVESAASSVQASTTSGKKTCCASSHSRA